MGRDTKPGGVGQPVTWLTAVGVTAGVVALVAEGTLAKLLAAPLALAVAWVLVLAGERRGGKPDLLGRDRRMAVAGVLALTLGVGVVIASLGSDRSEVVVAVVTTIKGHSPGGKPARSPGNARGGFAPSGRATYECTLRDGACESGVDHVVFNSYVNAPNYGDERAFVDAKLSGDKSKDGYRDRLAVSAGEKITIRVYIDNNADVLMAHGTVLTVLVDQRRGRRLLAAGQIVAKDADPYAVSDTVEFISAEPIGLQFDRSLPPQVTLRPSATKRFRTINLPSVHFPDAGTFTARLGAWPPGFEATALVTATLIVT